MKRSLIILPIVAMALALSGCTAMFNLSAYGTSDLYRTNNRAEVAAQLKAEAEAERLEAEARQAQWEARLAEANAAQAEAAYYATINNQPSFTNVVADDYQSAYARRLYGFQSPTYNMPSSYYDLVNSSSIYYVTAYDPSYYNVMVSGNQVWVEPKYITSMFGSWGATNVTYGLYASPWNYGWSYRVDPFYYSMWGYPRYSWYDWNWNICYNPYYYDWYWYGCYYDPYYHHHHHHSHHPGYHPAPAPPAHRPGHNPGHKPGNNPAPDYRPGGTTGSGASSGPGNLNGNRVNTGDRYTSPTSNRNYGSSDNRVNLRPANGGSTSQGFNGATLTPTTNTNQNNSYVVSDTRIDGVNISNSGSSSSSGNGNFRVGTINNSNSSSTRNNGTSSSSSSNVQSSKVNGSSTNSNSNFRQGSSSSSSTRSGSQSSGGRVSSSSSSSTNKSSSNSNYRSGSSYSSSSRSSSSSSSISSSRSTSSSSSRSSSSGSSGSFRSGGSSSGSSRR